MSRYIKVDALRNAMYHEAFETDTEMQRWDSGCWIRYKLFENILEQQPIADVVEVVRCCDADKGDCMFNHWHETPNGEKYHICNLNQLAFSEHEDFYCAYGERIEDDKE